MINFFRTLKKKILRKITITIFNKRKPLNLILFDILFNFFFAKSKNRQDFIKNFKNDGFVKLDVDIKDEIKQINQNLKLKNIEENPPYEFSPNNEIREAVDKIINVKLKNKLEEIEKYYNSKILPAYICLRRNVYYEKINNIDLFSDNFHNDAYTCTHLKIFINLMDTKVEHGPMKIVSKKNLRRFIKNSSYKDRSDYNETNVKDLVFDNTGKIGECLLFDPTNCMHRASIPQKGFHRDYLIITFVCFPKKNFLSENFKNFDIFIYEKNPLIKFCKPASISSTIKLFSRYIN